MTRHRSILHISFAGAVFCLLSACGGDAEPVATGPCSSGQKAEAPKADATEKSASTGSEQGGWATALTEADFVTYGQQIFLTKGGNTCNDCHGADGKKGRLAQAADLTQPQTWRATRALSGDKAKVSEALSYLISNGGTKFNENYAKDHPDAGWDWAKADATAYDIQMFGVTQDATKAEIKKIRKTLKKKGVSMDKSALVAFGTKAVLAYLDTLAAAAPTEADDKSDKGKKDKTK